MPRAATRPARRASRAQGVGRVLVMATGRMHTPVRSSVTETLSLAGAAHWLVPLGYGRETAVERGGESRR